jgi:cation transport protein ChaC
VSPIFYDSKNPAPNPAPDLLKHESTDLVWGAAYHIPSQYVAEVREYLDIREINGYSIQFTPFHTAPATISTATSLPSNETGPGIRKTSTTEITEENANVIRCLVYIGLPSNPQFLGPQDPDALARKILESKGPSGENREYLYMLEEALRGLSRESRDAHVSDLVTRCREIEGVDGKEYGEQEGGIGEMEEVEK